MPFNVAPEPFLFGPHLGHFSIVEVRLDPSIEAILVHDFQTTGQGQQLSFQLSNRLFPGAPLAGPAGQDGMLEQRQDLRRNGHAIQRLRDLVGNQLFPGVGLGTEGLRAAALVVDQVPFVQTARQDAGAVTALDQAGEREAVLQLLGPIPEMALEVLLDLVEDIRVDQWLVDALIHRATPFDLPLVEGIS